MGKCSLDSLKIRVLICFLRSADKMLSVTGLAAVLGEEKYTISRLLKHLEADGLLEADQKRRRRLTESGRMMAEVYAEKIDAATNYLLLEGINPIKAKEDAMTLSLYCSDETFELIRDLGVREQLKCSLGSQRRFDGNCFCRKLGDGVFRMPYIIYSQEHCDCERQISYNTIFDHPCLLEIKNGEGRISLAMHSGQPAAACPVGACSGRLQYYSDDQLLEAERIGNVLTFPINSMRFITVGGQDHQGLIGSLSLSFVLKRERGGKLAVKMPCLH